MKKILILISLLTLYGCSDDTKKYPVICDQVVIKYKEGVLYSTKHRTVNHYSIYTADELTTMLTGNTSITNSNNERWQTIIQTNCKDIIK